MFKSFVGDANPRPQPYGNKTNYYGVRAPIPGGTSTSRAATPVGHGQTQWWAQQPPCAQRGPYETSGNGFSATAHCEAVASAGSGFGAHGQYQFYNQQPPFEADDADGYSRSAWARLRTPSPKCFHRGFDRGWLNGGSAPAWSDASASVLPYAPKPRREPAPMQPAATVRQQADVQVPYNDAGMRGGDLGRAAPPPTARVATSPVQEVDKSVQFFDHSREVDAVEEDCTATGTVSWSRGSQGHPHSCNEPCKYNQKKRGCREGAGCDHCHICRWRPSVDRLFRKRAQRAAAAQGEQQTAWPLPK